MADEKDLEKDQNIDTEAFSEEEEKKKESREAAPDKDSSSEEEKAEDKKEQEAEASEEHNEATSSDKGPEDTKEDEYEGSKPDPRDRQIEELTDKYKRLFAEFDNFRKRTDAEKASMYDEGERYVISKLLSVVDNFERAMASVPEDLKASAYVDGIEKIYRAFTDLLNELGVTPIEAVGKEFDSNYHNAVMHIEDEDAGENMVVEEFQKGYMFRDKVLRYSMVKVAN